MLAVVTSRGSPSNVVVREVPEPAAAPGEVLVQVHAASVNRGELRLVARRQDGWVPGQDVAGTVAAAAPDGSGPPPGTPVVAWVDEGGWAQRVAAPVDRVIALPATVRPREAATLPVAGVTALRALRRGGLLLGRRVLVTGASGGVGRFAVEMAAGAGALVTAVAANAARARGLEELGAGSVVHDVEDATGPFDLVLESAGGRSLTAGVRALARDGVLVVYGNSSRESSTIEFGDIADSPDARIEVLRVYDSHDHATRRQDLQRLVDLMAAGRLHPEVGFEAPGDEAASVLAALARRHVNGKALILFGGAHAPRDPGR